MILLGSYTPHRNHFLIEVFTFLGIIALSKLRQQPSFALGSAMTNKYVSQKLPLDIQVEKETVLGVAPSGSTQ